MELNKIEGAIEALLFAMGESVELSTLAKTIGHDIETTRKIVRNMMLKYQAEDRGIKIIELENAYQMCTKEEYYDYLVKMALQPKKAVLSDVMLETLSIIAYKQPVTKLEIEKIRGVTCHSKAYGIRAGAGGRTLGCSGKTDFTWHYGGISPQF